jgi:hypothetical protein
MNNTLDQLSGLRRPQQWRQGNSHAAQKEPMLNKHELQKSYMIVICTVKTE